MSILGGAILSSTKTDQVYRGVLSLNELEGENGEMLREARPYGEAVWGFYKNAKHLSKGLVYTLDGVDRKDRRG